MRLTRIKILSFILRIISYGIFALSFFNRDKLGMIISLIAVGGLIGNDLYVEVMSQ